MALNIWSNYYPSSVALFDPPGTSDHSPCIINLGFDVPSTKKPFKFYRHVMAHPNYSLLLIEAWSSPDLYGTAQFILSNKMTSAKNCIKLLNCRHYSNIQKCVKDSFYALQAILAHLLLNPSQQLTDAESEARKKYSIYFNTEEQFFHQRSCIQWLLEGDSNTSFFHKSVLAKQALNRILYLRDGNDRKITKPAQFKQLAVQYFQDLLGTTNPLINPTCL